MSIFHDWTNRELAALSRATAKLRAQQPRDVFTKPTLRHCYYVPTRGYYHIDVYVHGKKYYAGTLREWDEDEAMAMQRHTEERVLNNIKEK